MVLVVAATEAELRGAQAIPGCETLVSGIGPIDAAASVARRLSSAPPVTAVLHVGIAGVRAAAGIPVRSLVVGDSSTYCDTDSRLVDRHIDADPKLRAAIIGAVPQARCIAIGTSADVGGSRDCEVEAMEGFGVLRAAQLAGVPAVEVRCISNEIEEPDRSVWDFSGALETLAAVLPSMVHAVIAKREG